MNQKRNAYEFNEAIHYVESFSFEEETKLDKSNDCTKSAFDLGNGADDGWSQSRRSNDGSESFDCCWGWAFDEIDGSICKVLENRGSNESVSTEGTLSVVPDDWGEFDDW